MRNEPDYAAYAEYLADMPWKGEKPRTANEQQLRDSYGPTRLQTICGTPSADQGVPTVKILEDGALPLIALLCGHRDALAAIDLATQSNPTAKPGLLAALAAVERYRR